jgi:hypothetical protein
VSSFFIHGAIAWATAFLVSIPIIIHLINRRRFRRIDWAAMEFLLEALKRNKRRIRIEQLILLLLRVAIMALLGFFLARPILSDKGLEWVASAFRSEDKIFLLDDSFSTSRREADRTTFLREIEPLQAQLRRFGERGTSDRFTLIRGSRYRNPIARGIFVDRERALSLSQVIAKLSPTDTRFPLADALDFIVEGSSLEGGVARPRSVSILTDLRAMDWTDGRGGPNEALHRALLRLSRSEESPTRILILDAGSDDTTSVAITSASIEGGKALLDIPADIHVEVRNFGRTSTRGLSLKLRHAPSPQLTGEDSGAATVLGPPLSELGPGETVACDVPCTFRSLGHYGVVVELSGAGDPLLGDNSSPLAVEVVASNEVLLVNGRPSSEPFEGETDFLEQALAPSGEVASGVKPTVVTEDNLPRQGLERYAAIFAANLNSFPQDFLPLLGRYVREGGALLLFLGDQVDASLYNRQLGKDLKPPPSPSGAPGEGAIPGKEEARAERGLLPARIGDLRQEAESPLNLSPAFDHPYFRLLRDASDLVAMVRFQKHFRLEPYPSAQVLARFSDAEGSPAIVEGAVEKGRVILFASTADLDWNDWARSPTYLMVLQEIVSAVARARRKKTDHFAGNPVEEPVDIRSYSRDGRLRVPGYPSQPERAILASPAPAEPAQAKAESSAAFRFLLEDTEKAGLYAIALKTKSGEEEWHQLAVSRDPAESDLAPLSSQKLRDLYPDVDLTVIKDATALAGVGRGRFEISDFLLWAFLAFLFTEGFLARWFAHHRGGNP